MTQKISEWLVEEFGEGDGCYIDVDQYGLAEILTKVRAFEKEANDLLIAYKENIKRLQAICDRQHYELNLITKYLDYAHQVAWNEAKDIL